MGEIRVTSAGTYLEIENDLGVITHAGSYIDIESILAHITHAGTYVEIIPISSSLLRIYGANKTSTKDIKAGGKQ